MLFCDRFKYLPDAVPSPPNVTYSAISGTAPEWAAAVDLDTNSSQVYFELEVIFADPVAELTAQNIAIEAGNEKYNVLSAIDHPVGILSEFFAFQMENACFC